MSSLLSPSTGGGYSVILVLSICYAVWNYSAHALMLLFFGFLLCIWAWVSAWDLYLFRYRIRGFLSSFRLFDVSAIFLGSQSPISPCSSMTGPDLMQGQGNKNKGKNGNVSFTLWLVAFTYLFIYLASSLARMRKFFSAFLMCVSTVPFVTWGTWTKLHLVKAERWRS